jgi:lysophospholipid acyltransferase (LPLAT)-like uncharacterized protein
MKALRSPGFIRFAAGVMSAYLRFAHRTTRWTWDGVEKAEQVWARPGGAILCLWHYNVPLSAVCWPPGRGQEMRVLISQSADGEFIAQTMQRLGFGSIRGSTAKNKDQTKTKGGAAAFRALLRWIKDGGAVAITPDGPRGPAQVMGDGPVLLAGLTGAPIILCGLATKPGFRLKTWDRTAFPVPFGRGVIAWDGPVHVPKGSDAAALETARAALEQRLRAVTARAEALAA